MVYILISFDFSTGYVNQGIILIINTIWAFHGFPKDIIGPNSVCAKKETHFKKGKSNPKWQCRGFCFCKKTNLCFFCFPLEENQIKNIFLLPLNYCAALSRVSWFLFLPNTSSWQIGPSTELSQYSIKMTKTRPIRYSSDSGDNWTNSLLSTRTQHPKHKVDTYLVALNYNAWS